jgi:hypothetical protein
MIDLNTKHEEGAACGYLWTLLLHVDQETSNKLIDEMASRFDKKAGWIRSPCIQLLQPPK